VTRDDLREALAHPNTQAFLAVIDRGEHGPHALSPERYRTLYGGTTFAAPPWEHPRRKVTAGRWTSTAAGRGQFLAATWDALVARYQFPDFSPECQDEAMVALIHGRKALADVLAGRFEEAIGKCAREWASLPGSPYGQPTLTMDEARAVYLERGGTLSTQAPEPDFDPDSLATEHYEGPEPYRYTPQEPRKSTQETAMPLPLAPIAIAAAQAFLPRLVDLIPALGAAFGSGSEVQKRNVAAATMVADAVTKTLGEPNLQAAIERMEADPGALAQAREAVTSILPTLVEAGGGGLEGARKAAESQSGDWRKLVFSLPFVGLVAFLPTIWAVVAAAVFRASWLLEMDPQMRGTVIGFVMGTIAGGIVMYVYGASMTKGAATNPK